MSETNFNVKEAAKLLSPQKQLGQNFLLDPAICTKIAQVAGNLEKKTVFEIGPGPGGLTTALLRSNAKKIIAIEYDHRCIEVLKPLVAESNGRLDVIHADALHFDFSKYVDDKFFVVSNLPYTISTQLLFKWLPYFSKFEKMVLMFQKEVAMRLIGVPRTKDYGKLSVLMQWKSKVNKVFDLPPGCFFPPPKVTSSVVEIIPFADKEEFSMYELVEKIGRMGFEQRRKTLRNSLSSFCSDIETFLKDLGISHMSRAEELSVDDFVDIAKKYRETNPKMVK